MKTKEMLLKSGGFKSTKEAIEFYLKVIMNLNYSEKIVDQAIENYQILRSE